MSRPLVEATAELKKCIASAGHVLVCLDCDGTLTAFADHPDAVFLTPKLLQTIQTLAAKDRATVAIISGRNRADLQGRIHVPNLFYAGNHGLEISGPGVLFIEPTAVSCAGELKELEVELKRKLEPIAGALVENKGLTLSIHYRMAATADQEPIQRIVQGILARSDYPFMLKTGTLVYEIRPRTGWNKGSAVDWIKQRIGKPNTVVVYVGDDATDEDAFAALTSEITVKVGDTWDTAALYHVKDPPEVHAFLHWLEEHLS